MSSLEKMLSILDLFNENKNILSIEEITTKLDVSTPTGYRYLKTLCDSGLVAKIDGGFYIIGPKIIKLDHQIRNTDPLIKGGSLILKELSNTTGCEALVSNIYMDEIINIHSESPSENQTDISYSRGIPHPIFKGATSIIIIANLPNYRLRKLYDDNKEEVKRNKLGEHWKEFKDNLSKIKKQGYSVSHGQLDDGISGIAAPIFANNLVIGSLTLVLPTSRLKVYDFNKLVSLITEAAEKISESISYPLKNE